MRWFLHFLFLNFMLIIKHLINAQFLGGQFSAPSYPLNQQAARLVQNSGIPTLESLQNIQGVQGLQGIRGLQGIQGLQGLQGYFLIFLCIIIIDFRLNIQQLQALQALQNIQGLQGLGGGAGTVNSPPALNTAALNGVAASPFTAANS